MGMRHDEKIAEIKRENKNCARDEKRKKQNKKRDTNEEDGDTTNRFCRQSRTTVRD